MPVIDPVPVEALRQGKLGKMLALAEDLQVPDARFFRILARAPGYAEALFDAMYRSHAEGAVDHQLKEIIRIQLARRAGDTYFASLRSARAREAGLTEERIEAGCGDFEHDPAFSDAEKWALRYAYRMYREPERIDQAFYDEGKTFYSEAEIMELGSFIALHYGMQVFMRTLEFVPA